MLNSNHKLTQESGAFADNRTTEGKQLQKTNEMLFVFVFLFSNSFVFVFVFVFLT